MLAEKLLPKSENKMLIALNDIINEIENKSMTYVIWGAGNTGRETEKYIHEKTKGRISVRYTVDNDNVIAIAITMVRTRSNVLLFPEVFFSSLFRLINTMGIIVN